MVWEAGLTTPPTRLSEDLSEWERSFAPRVLPRSMLPALNSRTPAQPGPYACLTTTSKWSSSFGEPGGVTDSVWVAVVRDAARDALQLIKADTLQHTAQVPATC